MTWKQLGELISGMTNHDLMQDVQFREPYDDDAEIMPVSVVFASSDIVGCSDETTSVRSGEPYLSA